MNAEIERLEKFLPVLDDLESQVIHPKPSSWGKAAIDIRALLERVKGLEGFLNRLVQIPSASSETLPLLVTLQSDVVNSKALNSTPKAQP